MASKRVSPDRTHANFVIITGLSGSGMSSATNAFEDIGFFCVDNLPLTMLSTFSRLLVPDAEGVAGLEKAALVINIRERHFLQVFEKELDKLKKKGLRPFIIFFEASDDVLARRFSETRRPHPAETGSGLLKAIRSERRSMLPVKKIADMIVDTSEHTVHSLRRMLIENFTPTAEGNPLRIQFVSFGHKYGNPRDLDLLFDVRHLPNPYFDRTLKDLTGEDRKVVSFLKKYPEVNESIRRFSDLLDYLVPFYQREGKSYLTIGVGCTGGKHRSVMVANELKKHLAKCGYKTSVNHRDMQK